MSLFSFKFYKAYYYFIIYWALDILNNIEWGNFQSKFNYEYYYNNFYDYKLDINTKYYFPFAIETELLNLMNLVLADISFGFLVLYTYFRLNYLRRPKDENQNDTRSSNNLIELIYNEPSNKKKRTILILFISLLDFFARSMELFFFLIICPEKAEEKNIRWLITFEILPRIPFCFYFLKIKFYRHHYLAMLFLFIGFLITSILGIISIETKNQRMYVFTMVIPKVIYALEDTINKIIITDKFVLPHFLIFFRGVVNSILVTIVFLGLYATSNIDFRYYDNIINNIQIGEILFKMLSFIFMICKIFCIFEIIYIFTPQHVGFCIVIIYLYNALKNMILTDDFQNEFFYCLLHVICLLFIAFGTIVFNEMLIINYWGLNENTKSGIMKRERIESIELQMQYTMNSEDSDDIEFHKESLSQIARESEQNP